MTRTRSLIIGAELARVFDWRSNFVLVHAEDGKDLTVRVIDLLSRLGASQHDFAACED